MAILLCQIVLAGEGVLSENPNLKCLKEDAGAPITAIVEYDSGRAAICGDQAGNIYRITANGCQKITSSTLGPIDSIIYGGASAGTFCFLSKGRIYEYKDEQIIDISDNLNEGVKEIYQNKHSNRIYAVTNNDKIYYYSSDNEQYWIPATNTGKKTLNSAASSSYSKNSSKNKNFLRSAKEDSNHLGSNDGKFVATNNGQIYLNKLYAPQTLTANAEFISNAVGTDTGRAIYRITIDGNRLDTNDIFRTGYNGFKYMLIGDDEQYISFAYPINGVIYGSDDTTATLQNREISFLWLGPKCDQNIHHDLTVKELAYNFSTNMFGEIQQGALIHLPEARSLDYSQYEVEVQTEDGTGTVNTYSNGTCGMPFNIIIRDSNNNILPPDNEAYNHLVFYAHDAGQSSPRTNGLIGCNPFSSDSDYLAILPADSVELDHIYIKYGKVGLNCKTSGGRTYYAYTKADGPHYIYAGFIKWDGRKYVLATSVSLTITGTTPNSSISPDNANLNWAGGRNFTFPSGDACSNWQGNKRGEYAGYLDYQLANYGTIAWQGIYVYLPEGLNTRAIDERKDLRIYQLRTGYYFDPQPSQESPLMATCYHLNDTTSYSDEMRGKLLHALLFDRYGACASYDVQDNNSVSTEWEIYKKCQTTNAMDDNEKMAIILANNANIPIVMGSVPSNSSLEIRGIDYGVTSRGLFCSAKNLGNIISNQYYSMV